MGGLYTSFEYTDRLRYFVAMDEDIIISSLAPEGDTVGGDEPICSFSELFAPLIWEALYPVVASRYVEVEYEQAA